jgi:catechol 2,3-dioxygenase-like lactoylglutathione lyase family enzyme
LLSRPSGRDDLDRAEKIRNRGLAVSQKRALVNLDAMRVKGLAWLGIPARDYAAAVRFFGETLDLEVAFDAGNTVELTAGNDDRIQLFGPGHRYFEFYRSHGDSTVPLLEVDDLDQARPSWPAAAPSYSASRSQTSPGPGSPSGRPTGTSPAWAPACVAGRQEDSGRTRSTCGMRA